MYQPHSLIAIPCIISSAGFSSERTFRVTLPEGSEHVSAAPVDYFFTEGKTQLSPDQATQRGISVKGYLAGRIVTHYPDDTYLISVPSGEVLRLPSSDIIPYPSGDRGHVSVES